MATSAMVRSEFRDIQHARVYWRNIDRQKRIIVDGVLHVLRDGELWPVRVYRREVEA